MPTSGPFGPSKTGFLKSAWRPRKSVTVLWRRVETLTVAAYDELMAWVRAQAAPGEHFPWLEAMATNEVAVPAGEAIAEVTRLLQRHPPAPVRESAELLRDLIWEASEPGSDWLRWPCCRRCGRRWAVAPYEDVPLCPRHHDPEALAGYYRDEMSRYPGLVDYTERLAALAARRAEPNGNQSSGVSGQGSGIRDQGPESTDGGGSRGELPLPDARRVEPIAEYRTEPGTDP